MKRLLIFVMIVFSLTDLFAIDKITPDIYRKINYNSLRLIEDYESYCTFKGNNSDISFISLFTKNATVYNDYLPFNDKQYLTPEEYFNITQEEKTKSVINVDISEVCFIDSLEIFGKNTFGLKIELKKKIIFRNWNSLRYPETNFDLIFNILVKTNTADEIECKIRTITCKPDSEIKEFSIAKINMKNINSKFEQIKINNKKLDIEKDVIEKTVFLSHISDPRKVFSLESYNAFLTFKTDSCLRPDKHIYYVKKQNYKSDFGVNTFCSIFPNYYLLSNRNVPDNESKNINVSMNGVGLGLNYSTCFLEFRESALYINIGLGIEKNLMRFSGDYYFEKKSKDIDGDNYIRQTELKDIDEKLNLDYLYLPIGIEYKYVVNKDLSLQSVLGAKGYFLFYKTFSLKANATYKGYYDQYYQLTMDRYYDFGNFDLYFNKNSIDLTPFNYGLYAGIGAGYKINKKYTASVKLVYDFTFMKLSDGLDEYIISEDRYDYASLINSYSSVKRDLNFIFAINYNF